MGGVDVGLVLARLEELFGVNIRRDSPFRVLVTTVLSQRTRDQVTVEAARCLLERYPSPVELARADVDEIAAVIRAVGFYRVKAARLREISRVLLEEYNGSVPGDLEGLLRLPGVGRKTANCVLLYGFGVDVIPVDTHVHRISNRLGLVSTSTPSESERELVRVVPREYWGKINPLFVRFGQEICLPQRPRCGSCPLFQVCQNPEKKID